jgi:uncharacterized membrane protein
VKQTFSAAHPRLLFAAAAGIVFAWVLPSNVLAATRVLVGWDVTVWSYLCLIGWLVGRSAPGKLQATAEQEDRNGLFIVVMLSIGAVLSLAAIVLELSHVKDVRGSLRAFHYVLTAATVFGSWTLVGVTYAFHYARLYYRSPHGARALAFPDKPASPGYVDFFYFSFTIAVAAQTSDVSVMNGQMRKAVLAQSIISFMFNVAIIGLSINIAASLVGT